MELPGLTAAAATGQSQPQRACPRCNSNNTKFCYYNNYSLSQPRYFCKGCRRYWTHGGTLRNVPVGCSSRKSKRPRDHSSSSASSASPSPQPAAPTGDHDAIASPSSLALPAMAPNLFQLHGGVGVGLGGGFLSSMRLQPPVLQGRHDFAVPFEWQQSFIGGGCDHGKAPPAVTGAQFWTLGGATSSGGGGDGGHRGNPDQCVSFPAVTRVDSVADEEKFRRGRKVRAEGQWWMTQQLTRGATASPNPPVSALELINRCSNPNLTIYGRS